MTDFGMAKLYDVNRSTAHLTPLTLCPGTVAYMSPEALGEPPVYTRKLDSFSLGVLGVQIMTRQFPDPGNRFQVIEISDPGFLLVETRFTCWGVGVRVANFLSQFSPVH